MTRKSLVTIVAGAGIFVGGLASAEEVNLGKAEEVNLGRYLQQLGPLDPNIGIYEVTQNTETGVLTPDRVGTIFMNNRLGTSVYTEEGFGGGLRIEIDSNADPFQLALYDQFIEQGYGPQLTSVDLTPEAEALLRRRLERFGKVEELLERSGGDTNNDQGGNTPSGNPTGPTGPI